MTSGNNDISTPDVELEQLLDLQIPQWIKLSPSGKQVVYSTGLYMDHRTGENARSTIWLAETGKEKSARQLTSGLFNDEMPQWCPDEESIAFLSDRAKPGQSCAIYQLPLRGGEAFPLTSTDNERQISQFTWRPDGKFIAYLSPDEKTAEQKRKEESKDDAQVYGEDWELNRLRLLHVSSRTSEVLLKRDSHIREVAWNDDGSALAFTTQQTPERESPYENGATIECMNIADRTTKIVSRGQCSVSSICWLQDDIYFIAGATPGKNNTSYSLYSVSSNKIESTWTKLAGGKVDCVKGIVKVKSSLFLMVAYGLLSEVRTMQGEVILSDMAESDAWDTEVSSEGKIVVAVAKSTVSTPTEVYSLEGGDTERLDEKNMRQLSTHGESVPPRQRGLTVLSVNSFDKKVMLDGFFVTPTKDTSKAWPTVVLIRGGPYYRTTVSFFPDYGWAPYLLSAGYAVLFPNYRGGAGHGEEYAAYARGGVGTVEYDDVLALTQHCIERGFIDKENMIASGWSQGGFLSYLSAVRNGMHGLGWKFQAAICGAGVTDWDSMAITSDLPAFESELGGIAPWEAEKTNLLARRGSPLWEMAEAGKAGRIPPVLLLHGEKDVRVPINQAWAFHRGCKKWKVPCELVTYPREGHAFAERAHFVDMFRRVRKFCDVHLS